MPDPNQSQDPVDTGNRRDEAHYESDPDQLVRASFTFEPGAPLPAQEQSEASENGVAGAQPGLQDVGVTRDQSSAWDARPVEDHDDTGR